jgi:hypothetical protein
LSIPILFSLKAEVLLFSKAVIVSDYFPLNAKDLRVQVPITELRI